MIAPVDGKPARSSRMAQECGDSYWLYVVENAGTDSPNIVRIQDPAGKARTFTFDHGWLAMSRSLTTLMRVILLKGRPIAQRATPRRRDRGGSQHRHCGAGRNPEDRGTGHRPLHAVESAGCCRAGVV